MELKQETLLISETAKQVGVETHVLRYWEEELQLPIKRNDMGHRYYTAEDVKRFKEIKVMKEQGLQLKAIKTILQNEGLELGGKEDNSDDFLLGKRQKFVVSLSEDSDKEEKAKRLQYLLQHMMAETVKNANKELCTEIKESILKELDYQFRIREEREEEQWKKEEEHFRKIDEMLRARYKSREKTPKNREKTPKNRRENKSGKKGWIGS
ncbi:MAG: helix-turn-helix domain-containing protein [Butyrivibrio sp.]|nr:helix-turn-helix domain-containing protein [Butyrivibrio sp.]